MSKILHLDLANLCSLSYHNKVDFRKTFNSRNMEMSYRNANVFLSYTGNYDVQAYVCQYEDTITIAFRGTESSEDILTDLKLFQVPFYLLIFLAETPNVHQGFNFNSKL